MFMRDFLTFSHLCLMKSKEKRQFLSLKISLSVLMLYNGFEWEKAL